MDFERVLETSIERRKYLTYLSETSARPRDLVDELGDSRATVHRATDELEEDGLIEQRGDGSWEITEKGRLVHRTIDDAEEIIDGLDRGSELLDDLPETVAVPPAVFSRCTLGIPSPPSPTSPLKRSLEKFRRADRIRGIALGDTVPELAETVYERGAVEGELEVEYVLSSDLFEWYREDSPDMLSGVLSSSNVEVLVHDAVPIGLTVWEIDGEWEMQLITYDDDGTYSGNVVSEHPVAVDWAHETVTEFQEEARPVPDPRPRSAGTRPR